MGATELAGVGWHLALRVWVAVVRMQSEMDLSMKYISGH